MSDASCAIIVSGFSVNVVYADERMTLYFDSKDGSVSVRVPPGSGFEEVRKFVESGIPWIEGQREKHRPGRTETVEVDGMTITVVRKPKASMTITFFPETGAATVSARSSEDMEKIKDFVRSSAPWMERQKKKHAKEKASAEAAYAPGSEHYLFGKRHVLNIIESEARSRIELDSDNSVINAYVEPGSSAMRVEHSMDFFYKRRMIATIPALLKKWNGKAGLTVAEVKVRKMKTQWGSCNSRERRVWLNSRLASKSMRAIDYVFAHEMAHLAVGAHNKRFYSMVGRIMPDWKMGRYDLLGSDASSDLVD